MSEHDKTSEETRAGRRRKSGEGLSEGAAPWEQLLDESLAWQALTAEANLQFMDDGFRAAPGTVDRARAGAILNAAEIILEGRGWRVTGGVEPTLSVRVVED